MKHIVSYSGGLGSAITAKMVVDRFGKENTILLFADTLMEDEDLYRFNSDIETILDVSITTIEEGRTPWQVFEDVKYIGNTKVDPCSRVLKRDLIRKWLGSNYTPEDVTVWIGIDCTEMHRLEPVVEKNKPYRYRSALIERNVFLTESLKQAWCDAMYVKAPRLYKMGFAHNNCGGFCVKAGQGQFKKLFDNLPDRYLHHEQKEQDAMNRNKNLKPFLRKTINGKLHYLTLKEFRVNHLEKNSLSEDDKQEFGGCGCAL